MAEPDPASGASPGMQVRAEELRYVVTCLRQQECCSVVGPSNSGKSRLLRSLVKYHIRQACARHEGEQVLMVYISLLRPVETELALYELILRRVIGESERSGMPQSCVVHLAEGYKHLERITGDLESRRVFEDTMRELGADSATRLVLVLDEFEDVFTALPAAPFRELRVLRYDPHGLGKRLCYVVATSRHLGRLRSDEATSEFREMFDAHTLVLKPLSEEDSQRLVDVLINELGDGQYSVDMQKLAALSGGHPGLLARVLHICKSGRTDCRGSLEAVARRLSRAWPIQEECQRLWNELEAEEQAGLHAMILDDEPSPESLHGLRTKGLALERQGRLRVFSPVFAAFLRQGLGKELQGARDWLDYDEDTRQVFRDRENITYRLSAHQHALFAYLWQNAGSVCTKDEIAQAVWPDECLDGISDGQIYELVKRLRAKVEPDPARPRHILTLRGLGYQLDRTPEAGRDTDA